MKFAIDSTALLVLIICILIAAFLKSFLKNFPRPSLAFSSLTHLSDHNWRSILASLPSKLQQCALICLMIAFIDPHLLFPKKDIEKSSISSYPKKGLAIYLVLDRSGSMSQPAGHSDSKLSLLKEVTKEFIDQHPDDLIGLVSFARVPTILVPLTLDKKALQQALQKVEVVKDPNEEGSAIGYAIYKTAHLLATTRYFANQSQLEGKPPYTIKNAAIIVVTDGFQDPSRLDYGNRLRTLELDDAAAYVKSEQTRLYIINIDPTIATSKYAPQRRELEKITELTEGKFFMVSDSQDLKDIYSTINRLEKGTVQIPSQPKNKEDYSRFSFFPFFLMFGMAFLFLAHFLDLTFIRKIP